MTSPLARKPAFWIVVLVASAVCVFSVLHWFGDAFSVLDLDVRLSRTTAIDDARRLAQNQQLIDVAPTEAVARFDGDNSAQTFIELEGGGKPALKPVLGSGEFTLYKWRVRPSRRASNAKCRSRSRRTDGPPASSAAFPKRRPAPR